MKNTQVFILSATQDTVPRSKSGTGTITSNGTQIRGTGTFFTSQLNIDDWVYIKGQNAVRRIVNVVSDVGLTIDEPFATALSGATFFITPASRLKEISGIVEGTAVVKIDGVNFGVGGTFGFNKAQREGSWSKDFLDPIDIDATAVGASIKITTN